MRKNVQPVQKTENADVVAASPLAATGVEKMILVIRDKQVLLDRDLATLYGVETKALNQAVKRNAERFPERYCFRLKPQEYMFLRSQSVTSKKEDNLKSQNATSKRETRGGRQYLPYVFTEQGIAMLSAVLRSDTAVRVSIAIMDAFVALRRYMLENGDVSNRLVRVEGKEIEQDRRLLEHDRKIDSLFEAMDRREADMQKVMENFVDPSTFKHFLILNGQKLEADVAYAQIYDMAKESLLIVDNYVNVKTLNLLRNVPKGISVLIFSDQNGSTRLTNLFHLSILFMHFDNPRDSRHRPFGPYVHSRRGPSTFLMVLLDSW